MSFDKPVSGVPPVGDQAQAYDEVAWEKLKTGFTADAVLKGRKLGVPEEIIQKHAEAVIERKVEDGDLSTVYRIRKNLKIGSADQLRRAGEAAFAQAMDIGDYKPAQDLAAAVFGGESEQSLAAKDAFDSVVAAVTARPYISEAEREPDLVLRISRDATFAQLFAVMEEAEASGVGKVYLFPLLIDNFPENTVLDVQALFDKREGVGATVRVVDFFAETEHTIEDIEALLPIKFKN